jgi:signal transduction histidine kinase
MEALLKLRPLFERAAALGRRFEALALAASLVLAAVLGYLYFRTPAVDFHLQSTILALLAEYRELDARWDRELWRARAGLEPAPASDEEAALARLNAEFKAACAALGSPTLDAAAPALEEAFAHKADMLRKFRKAHAAAREALARVLGAEPEIAGLVRGAWREFGERERLVGAESVVVQLLAEVHKYYHAPASARRAAIEALLADLREAGKHLPAPLAAGFARLEADVQQLLGAKPVEHALFERLSFLTAGPRVAGLTRAYARELEQTLAERERMRLYLGAYAAALLVLLAYLAARLVASYRQLNAANEALERRVAERTAELSRALEQLKESELQLIQSEKMSSLGQMVAGVAHEINTPLAYVKNGVGAIAEKLSELARASAACERLCALLRDPRRDPAELSRAFGLAERALGALRERGTLEELQQLARDGLHGIERIAAMVVNLRNFARLDRAQVSRFDLNEGVEATLLLAGHELKRHTVVKRLGAIPPITCSPSQINQVLLNLVNNAAQAIETAPGVITITTRREGDDHVAVEVEDNGRGIAPEHLSRIFDPFFTTKEVGQGTGLGLAIAYKIVEQHGGRIGVESTPGVGTKFTMVLPLTPPAGGSPA